jgi:lipopolysaccharide export LptBFGC system permease protein LptF
MEDVPRIACYSLIVKISCLLVYFDFELCPLAEARFENGKAMLKVGSDSDLFELYFKLKDLADGLETDIAYYNENFNPEQEFDTLNLFRITEKLG